MTHRSWAAVLTAALFLSATTALLSGCSSLSILQSRKARADTVAKNHGWVAQRITANSFSLLGYRPAARRNGDTLVVYIEGDGVAWTTPTRRSNDPTPDSPLTLKLAVQDPNPNRLYLARPCQYLTPRALASCAPRYWTSHRYAPEVVAALSTAIDRVKRSSNAKRVFLFGYSGGGALAVLIAAARTDVARIVTIAANLDHVAWTRMSRDTPLYGSLNPADYASRVSSIPQMHLVGLDDEVVPPAVAESYIRRVSNRERTKIVKVPGADHNCCWVERWPNLLRNQIYRVP